MSLLPMEWFFAKLGIVFFLRAHLMHSRKKSDILFRGARSWPARAVLSGLVQGKVGDLSVKLP